MRLSMRQEENKALATEEDHGYHGGADSSRVFNELDHNEWPSQPEPRKI